MEYKEYVSDIINIAIEEVQSPWEAWWKQGDKIVELKIELPKYSLAQIARDTKKSKDYIQDRYKGAFNFIMRERSRIVSPSHHLLVAEMVPIKEDWSKYITQAGEQGLSLSQLEAILRSIYPKEEKPITPKPNKVASLTNPVETNGKDGDSEETPKKHAAQYLLEIWPSLQMLCAPTDITGIAGHLPKSIIEQMAKGMPECIDRLREILRLIKDRERTTR